AAEEEIVQNGVGRDFYERAAVVIGLYLDARRQRAVVIELFRLLFDKWQHGVRVLRAAHEQDRGGDVVIVIPSRDAQPGHIANIDLGDVTNRHRHAVGLRKDDVFYVYGARSPGKVVVPAIVDETDAANIDRLLPDLDLAAADVDIGVADRRDDLRDRDVIGFELRQIDVDIELLGRAAPGVDLHHAGDRQHSAGDDVILDRAQIGQAEIRRALDLVTKDFAR